MFMKKFLLFFVGILLSSFAYAEDPNVIVVDDLGTYTGSEPYVFNQADGKLYVLNNTGAYELYGIVEKVDGLKVSSTEYTDVEYIESEMDHGNPYIVTNYVHKANTRIVVECDITDNAARDYEALFGSRAGYGNKMFVFFWRFGGSNAGCYARNAEVRGNTDLPRGQKITIDADGVTAKVYKNGETEPCATIAGEGAPQDGSTPMYIFDLCHADHADNSSAYMKLYSFKIYEGETLVMDLQPSVSPQGAPGLRDKLNKNNFFSAATGTLSVSADGQDAVAAGGGSTVYEGKLFWHKGEQAEYKYTNGEFVKVGTRQLVPYEVAEGYTNYKDFNTWTVDEGHRKCFFGGADPYNAVLTYDSENDVNTIVGYRGAGGFEPLFTKIATNAGEDYNYTFTFSCSQDWDTWNAGNYMNAVVVENITSATTTENGNGAGVLNHVELPHVATEAFDVNLDFTATRSETFLLNQFGYVADDVNYDFTFAHVTVKRYDYDVKYPVLNPFAPQLEILLGEIDSSYDPSTTTDYVNDLLPGYIEAARNALANGNLADQKKALEELQNVWGVYKEINIVVLKKIIEVAEPEGVDATAAKDFLVNGWEKSVLDKVTYELRAARKMIHMDKDENTYTAIPPSEGDFYIYNVGRKAYLSNGSDWGTHAALGFPGLLSTLAANGDGYTIQFNELIQGDARDKYLGGSPYVDCANDGKDTYFFEAVEGKQGVYHIKGSRGYLKYDPNGAVDGGGQSHFNTVTAMAATADGEDAEWILVTKEMRLALINTANANKPADATLLIKNPSFNKFNNLGNPWEGINQGWGWGDRHFGDKNTETWNSQEYEISQTITLPKKGTYDVTVQAYYRDGNIGDHVESVANGKELHAPAVLFAGSEETPLVYIHEAADMAPGEGTDTQIGNIPDNMLQAALFFENGCYVNKLRVYVEEDNAEVKIGIRKDGNDHRGGNWIVADNFRITYYGNTVLFDEAVDNSATVTANAGATAVSVKRSTVADTWNTLTVPFDMTQAQIEEVFGEGAQVAAIQPDETTGEALQFRTVNSVVAGMPYLLWPTKELSADEFTQIEGVTVKADALQETAVGGGQDYVFAGVYDRVAPTKWDYFVARDNKLKKNNDETSQLKAFRAYFKDLREHVPVGGDDIDDDDDILAKIFVVDGNTDGIILEDGTVAPLESVYTLAGQKVSAQSLKSGIYIVGGKKVVIK